jgi:RNA polymerase sigma-70 factor (sigma-E family)
MSAGGAVDRQTERAAFDDFVRGRSTALGRTAYLLTGNRQDAEDLLQTALARAATRWGRIDDAEAYVRRVLYTSAVSRWRQLRRHPAEVLGFTPVGHPAPAAVEVEVRMVLEQALARLTARQRAVLVLRFYEDRTEAQTAQVLGCAIGTVKSQTRHALARLRALSPELGDLVGGGGRVAADTNRNAGGAGRDAGQLDLVPRDQPERTARA